MKIHQLISQPSTLRRVIICLSLTLVVIIFAVGYKANQADALRLEEASRNYEKKWAEETAAREAATSDPTKWFSKTKATFTASDLARMTAKSEGKTWAEENQTWDRDDCGNNSSGFADGCSEYVESRHDEEHQAREENSTSAPRVQDNEIEEY